MAVRGLPILFQKQEPQGSLGAELGAGLGQGLQALAQQKMESLGQRQQMQQRAGGLQNLLNISPQEAQSLAGLDENILREVVKALGDQGRVSGIREALGGESVPDTQQASTGIDLTSPFLKPEDVIKTSEIRERRRAADQKISLDETRALRQESQQNRKAQEENINVINSMMELSKEGDLNDPLYVAGLKFFGLDDVKALLSPDSQQYQKYEQHFLKNINKLFPGRVTDRQLREYQRGLPTLMNTKEGRERVFNDMLKTAQGAILYDKEISKIMRETKNNPPLDLHDVVMERIHPKIDKIWKQTSFGKNLEGSHINMTHYVGERAFDEEGNPFLWDKEQRRYRRARIKG